MSAALQFQTAACVGKTPFMSYFAAEKVTCGKWAKRRKRKDGHRTGAFKIYRCPYCPNWHIGGME